MQDRVLGILLLKSNFNDLNNVTQLPYVLDTLNLQTSYLTSLFVLGNSSEIEKKFLPEGEKAESLNDLFINMLKQPANKDLPAHPIFGFNGSGYCSGIFMGCKVHVHYFKIEHEIIAEMIISVFESIRATLVEHRVFPHKSSFNIYIEKELSRKELDKPFEHSTSVKEGETVLNIRLGQKSINEYESIEDRLKVKNCLFETAVLILSHIAVVKNLDSTIDKMFGDEDAQNRALVFSELHIISSNIFGDEHVFNFEKFLEPHKHKPIYQVLRKVSWK